ncbi:hypothetical protein ACJX0J_036132, partial [Zea mays]
GLAVAWFSNSLMMINGDIAEYIEIYQRASMIWLRRFGKKKIKLLLMIDLPNENLTANFTMDEYDLIAPIFLLNVSFKIITKVLTNQIGLRKKLREAYDKQVIVKVNDGVCPFFGTYKGLLQGDPFKCLLFCYGLAKEYDLHYSLIFGCGIGDWGDDCSLSIFM